ncbi:MAG: triose-phosphate isomerase [Saprospiraceae bacterium]|jgi:triosephosphate isomerase
MSRKKIIAGNWKMNLLPGEGASLATQLIEAGLPEGAHVVLCPPFIHLPTVGALIHDVPGFYLGAQNCHQEGEGAYTGEVAAKMLRAIGVEYVILGHSERREYFGESNELLAKKVDRALQEGLSPIFCCGEALEIREAGTHTEYVARQLEASLFHLGATDFEKIAIAYEPIWAIGTGKTASPLQAQEMHAAIRTLIASKYGQQVAADTSILYGGSVGAGNAAELFAQPDVDGGLVGGASLKAGDFARIIAAAAAG